ncbi:MAG: glutathione peroxidase [Halopseudomonas sp.]
MPSHRITIGWVILSWFATLSPSWADTTASCPALLDHRFQRLANDASERLCDAHQGKLILVVNTASQCGYTYQYTGLEHLYQQYKDQGLVVIGFPSNDFGGQEPGSEKKIASFCRDSYSVQFPMYQKIHAAEGKAHPFFAALARQAKQYPSWNFHKYLIDRQGNVVGSWSSHTEPESSEISQRINKYL